MTLAPAAHQEVHRDKKTGKEHGAAGRDRVGRVTLLEQRCIAMLRGIRATPPIYHDVDSRTNPINGVALTPVLHGIAFVSRGAHVQADRGIPPRFMPDLLQSSYEAIVECKAIPSYSN